MPRRTKLDDLRSELAANQATLDEALAKDGLGDKIATALTALEAANSARDEANDLSSTVQTEASIRLGIKERKGPKDIPYTERYIKTFEDAVGWKWEDRDQLERRGERERRFDRLLQEFEDTLVAAEADVQGVVKRAKELEEASRAANKTWLELHAQVRNLENNIRRLTYLISEEEKARAARAFRAEVNAAPDATERKAKIDAARQKVEDINSGKIVVEWPPKDKP